MTKIIIIDTLKTSMDSDSQKPDITELVRELEAAVAEGSAEPAGEQNAEEILATAARLDVMSRELKKKVKTELATEGSATLAEAREILGEDFLGPDAVFKTYGRMLKPEEIPALPFPAEELQRMKRDGEMLVLDSDKDGSGKPLNMKNQNALLAPRFKVIRNPGDCAGQEYFEKDTPKFRWRAVTKGVVPGSLGANAVARMRARADYIKNVVYKEREIPKEYAEAIREFEEQEESLTAIIYSNWKLCNERLDGLRLGKLCGRIPAETTSDNNMYFDNTGKQLPSADGIYDANTRLSSSGASVNIGDAGPAGAYVDHWDPLGSFPYVGAVVSRSF